MERAKLNCGNRHIFAPKDRHHPRREFDELLLGKISAGDARLICDDHDGQSKCYGGSGEFKNPVDEIELFWSTYIPAIDVNDAVTVKE